jgi:muramoyltetrapeptide carboxypeptidase
VTDPLRPRALQPGYLDLIDFEAVRADPKPILGYSDISLLHLVLYARTG